MISFIQTLSFLLKKNKGDISIKKMVILSLTNTFLDLFSIALLTPIILFLINEEQFNDLLNKIGIHIEYASTSFLLGGLLLIFVLKNVIQTLIIKKQNTFLYAISNRLSMHLNKQFLYHNQPLVEKSILMRDFDKIPSIFAANILYPSYLVLSESIIVFLFLFSGILINFKITLIAFLIIAFGGILILKIRARKIKKYNLEIIDRYQQNYGNLMNTIYGKEEIQNAQKEDYYHRKYASTNTSLYQILANLSYFKQNNSKYLESLLLLLLLSFVFYKIFLQQVLVQDYLYVAFFISAIIRILPSFNKVITAIMDIKSNYQSLFILKKYFEAPTKKREHIRFQDDIQITQLGFHYEKHQKPVFFIPSLHISKGDIIGISGKSGIGKSTLLKVINGFLDAQTGSFYIDRIKKQKNTLLENAYLIPQSPLILKGSLLENITLTDAKKADISRIHQLMEVMDLNKWYASLEKGLDTQLDLHAPNLSGGQKQRITWIRALYQEPDLLLLDEATNQLDDLTETRILNYIQGLVSQKKLTVIMVYHKKSLDAFCSKTIQL